MKVIDRVVKSYVMSCKFQINWFLDGLSLFNEVVVFDDVFSEGGSLVGVD